MARCRASQGRRELVGRAQSGDILASFEQYCDSQARRWRAVASNKRAARCRSASVYFISLREHTTAATSRALASSCYIQRPASPHTKHAITFGGKPAPNRFERAPTMVTVFNMV